MTSQKFPFLSPSLSKILAALLGNTKVNILALTAVSKIKIRLTAYNFGKLRTRS